ncbi:DUF6894 family protein [Bradyrhizobium sp. sBnM-33]|uniref:DUF6894 family protein n=1 Tax=Bradyrhizobium sp. sBnM-33 TaxID=2831780 RepID=UPI001BCA835E|nr:hypothetical protein [Bradyrhizobium sp. sBnM-33]WOH48235.1 hypothetical protein RX328_29435 [Bradyrhizobium sp. sBnM-33]
MPQFFFIIQHDEQVVEPDIGIELPDMEAAWNEATRATGEIVRDLDGSLEVGTEWSIQIQDAERKPLRTIKVISKRH